MTTEAAIGYGSKFYLWDANAGPAAYVQLGEITSITPPSENTDIIDVTHMQSPNSYREFIQGLTDPGDCSIEMNFVSGSASDILIRAVRAARTAVSAKIEFPNADTWVFDVLVTGYEAGVPVDDKMTMNVTFKVTGSVAVTN